MQKRLVNYETLGTSTPAPFSTRVRVEQKFRTLEDAVKALFAASFSVCSAWSQIIFEVPEEPWEMMQVVTSWEDLQGFAAKNAGNSWNHDTCMIGEREIEYGTQNIGFRIEKLTDDERGYELRIILAYAEDIDEHGNHFRPYGHNDDLLRKVTGSMLRDAVAAGWELKVPEGIQFVFPTDQEVRAMHPKRFMHDYYLTIMDWSGVSSELNDDGATLECGFGSHEVPAGTLDEEAWRLTRETFERDGNVGPKSMYPEGVVAINTAKERGVRQVRVSCWKAYWSEETAQKWASHPQVIGVSLFTEEDYED